MTSYISRVQRKDDKFLGCWTHKYDFQLFNDIKCLIEKFNILKKIVILVFF